MAILAAIGTVLLVILKVILWIVAIIVALILLILFVPIQYRIKQTGFAAGVGLLPLKDIAKSCYTAVCDEEADNLITSVPVSAKVTWLFGIIGVVIKKKRQEGDFRLYFRFLWIPFRIKLKKAGKGKPRTDKKKPFWRKKGESLTPDAAVYMLEPIKQGEADENVITINDTKAQEVSQNNYISQKDDITSEKTGHSNDKQKNRVWKLFNKVLGFSISLNLKTVGLFRKLQEWATKISDGIILFLKKIFALVYTINASCDRINNMSKMVLYYTNLIRSDEFAAFIGVVKKELKFVLAHLAPSKLRIELNLGSTDSYNLARTQIYLSMLKPFLKKGLKIYVNPNEDYFGDTIFLRGRVQTFIALQAFLWYLRHKDYIGSFIARFKYSF